MTHPDQPRWDSRYATEAFVFGEEPNIFLRDLAAGLTPGKALCVADGEGRNGVWLARQGWDVLSLDFSAVAQRKAAALAARHGVTLHLEQGDVHDWPYPQAGFDLVADVFSQFSAPGDRLRKWAGMIRAVKPGGHLIVIGYTPRQLDFGTGGPRDPAHLYTANLLRSAFASLEILRLEEIETELSEGAGHSGMSAVAILLARAPL
ncbi:class I SAM-dependent methyltransferase [Gemmobacter nectariphilus]|jgi:SAM-dependent methyltransferase|uniref:class I SAM-dependent methyltransferase n=1 Tax=Gemmobacter nectariphilus TaxID=220343 RepID=UPI000425A3FD|nr:class I SAM-dependent methyltransferase [Gemmobacter nectariphilus]